MRQIEFRGKRKDNGEWVYGLYYAEPFYDGEDVYIEHVHIIITEQGNKYEVIPETVSQFTGMKDSTKWEELTEKEQKAWLATGKTKEEWKGREIYEGDVVEKTNPKCQYQKSIIHCIVVWEDDRYMLKVCNVFLWEHYNVEKPENGTFLFFSWIHKDCYKIIGNTTDNHELLEAK